MSSCRRKRPGGAADSRPAWKRSRLQPSSTAGTLEREPIELEESGTPALDPAGGQGLTSQSSVPEVVVVLSDDETPVDREQSQQQPHLSRASENSAEPQARDDEEEPRKDNVYWMLYDFDLLYWSDDDSELREQNQQHSNLSRSGENSAGPLTSCDQEEPGDNNGAWPAGPASPVMREEEDSEVQDREQSQQYPLGSRHTENSAQLWSSNNEEEPRDNDSSTNSSGWPDRFESPPTWQDDITDDSEESQPCPHGSRPEENELVPSNLLQEPRDIEFEWPDGLVSPPSWEDDNAQLLEDFEQQRRNATLNSHEQVDGSGNGTGANEAPVAESGPAEQGAAEEGTARSDSVPSSAQQGVIRCPICMDFYSKIVQSGRLIVATLCGHVFCSECLPVALETVGRCPICRMELTPDLYIPIYI